VPPRRYLSAGRLNEELGRARDSKVTIPHDAVIDTGGRPVYGYLPERAARREAAPDDPGLLGGDPSALPGAFLIGMRQWAALEGVRAGTVASWRRRGQLPAADVTFKVQGGTSPRWAMATYRAWKKTTSEKEGRQ
jgi:hypothetical protein